MMTMKMGGENEHDNNDDDRNDDEDYSRFVRRVLKLTAKDLAHARFLLLVLVIARPGAASTPLLVFFLNDFPLALASVAFS